MFLVPRTFSRWQRTPRCLLCGLGSRSAVTVSENRLQEFMQAEISYFAAMSPKAVTIGEILDASEPPRAAKLVHMELPVRFAARVKQIESVAGWENIPELKEVHAIYQASFTKLRLVELQSGLKDFHPVIKDLKTRHRPTVLLLASAMRKLQKDQGHSNQWIDRWLDTFLLSRIGTEMLTSQYIACAEASQRVKGSKAKGTGIVDSRCDPAKICQMATQHVQKICQEHYGDMAEQLDINVEVHIESGASVRFSYVPNYLFYIMVELLKNSCRATIERHRENNQVKEHPVTVVVCADENQVAININDKALGIPYAVSDKVWSYMYTTATPKDGADSFAQEGSPLAGYGVGLPLSRLYAKYLGGSLNLMSMPGVGTDVYLYLKRLETEAREAVPDSDDDRKFSWSLR